MPQEIISLEESRRLVELEEKIEKGLNTFIAVGEALAEIRDKRLYRSTHGTFEDYCKEEWEMTARHARNLMGAAEVAIGLAEMGTIVPKREAQMRPLISLPKDQQQQAWRNAVDSSGGVQPSTNQVEAAVQEVRSETEIPKREPAFQPSNGMQYANLAIDNLRKIQPNDTERDKAFMAVQRFITQNYQAK